MNFESLYSYKDAVAIDPTGDFFEFSTDPNEGVDFRNFSCDLTITSPEIPAAGLNNSSILYKISSAALLARFMQNSESNLEFNIGGYAMLDPNTSYCEPKNFITENQPETMAEIQQEMYFDEPVYAGGVVAASLNVLQNANNNDPFFNSQNAWISSEANTILAAENYNIKRVNLGFLFGGLFKTGFKKYPGKNESAYHYFILNQFCQIKLKDNFTFTFYAPVVTSVVAADGTNPVYAQKEFTVKINKIYETRAVVSEALKMLFSNVALLPKYYDEIREESELIRVPETDGWLKLSYSCTPFVGETYAIRRYSLEGLLRNCEKYTIRFNNLEKDVDGYNFFDGQEFSVEGNPDYKEISYLPDKDLTPSNENYIEFWLYFGDVNLTIEAGITAAFGPGYTPADLENGVGNLSFQCYSTEEFVVYNNENFEMIAALDAQTQQQIGNRILDYNPENYLQQKQPN